MSVLVTAHTDAAAAASSQGTLSNVFKLTESTPHLWQVYAACTCKVSGTLAALIKQLL